MRNGSRESFFSPTASIGHEPLTARRSNMKRQIEMEDTMLRAHQEFVKNLDQSLMLLAKELDEAAEVSHVCTDEWCVATEGMLDDLAKIVFSISEPRWLSNEDSKKISSLRHRLHDLYARYKAVKK